MSPSVSITKRVRTRAHARTSMTLDTYGFVLLDEGEATQ
jgi:hypothetical protein